MNWIRLVPALALTGSSSLAALARAPASAPLAVENVSWSVVTKTDGSLSLTLSRNDRNNRSSISKDLPSSIAIDARTLARPGLPVAFSLVREAGTFACSGASAEGRVAGGRCRFAGDATFERALGERAIGLPDRLRLYDLAALDVRVAAIGDLVRSGLPLKSVDDVLPVAALNVTGDYLRMLATISIRPGTAREAVACRAVGIDAAFVRGMVAAGYTRLTAQQAIRMRAVGVTPDYAQTMNRVARDGQLAIGQAR